MVALAAGVLAALPSAGTATTTVVLAFGAVSGLLERVVLPPQGNLDTARVGFLIITADSPGQATTGWQPSLTASP